MCFMWKNMEYFYMVLMGCFVYVCVCSKYGSKLTSFRGSLSLYVHHETWYDSARGPLLAYEAWKVVECEYVKAEVQRLWTQPCRSRDIMPACFWREWEKPRQILVRTGVNTVEITSGHLSNRSYRSFRLSHRAW